MTRFYLFKNPLTSSARISLHLKHSCWIIYIFETSVNRRNARATDSRPISSEQWVASARIAQNAEEYRRSGSVSDRKEKGKEKGSRARVCVLNAVNSCFFVENYLIWLDNVQAASRPCTKIKGRYPSSWIAPRTPSAFDIYEERQISTVVGHLVGQWCTTFRVQQPKTEANTCGTCDVKNSSNIFRSDSRRKLCTLI